MLSIIYGRVDQILTVSINHQQAFNVNILTRPNYDNKRPCLCNHWQALEALQTRICTTHTCKILSRHVSDTSNVQLVCLTLNKLGDC